MNKKSASTWLPSLRTSILYANRIYVLSPHIDDAVFSLGWILAELSNWQEVTIVNIFSRSSFAFGKEISEFEAAKVRKNEDQEVKKIAGRISFLNLDFPEALLRWIQKEWLFTNRITIDNFATLISNIVARMVPVVGIDSLVLCPSGFWDHVDHMVTREAGKRLRWKVIYYADLPYYWREVRQEGARQFLGWKSYFSLNPDEETIKKHLALSKKYSSQILERHILEMENQLKKEWYMFWQ